MLKNHNKSQIRKDISEWSQLERRLRHSDLSINLIGKLRDDFNDGWKTWDGSAFSTLPQALQSNSSKLAKTKAELASSTPILSGPKSIGVARPLYKPNNKPQANKRKRLKVQKDDYDSADGEWTAAKTVSTVIEPLILENPILHQAPSHANFPSLSVSQVSHHTPTSCRDPALYQHQHSRTRKGKRKQTRPKTQLLIPYGRPNTKPYTSFAPSPTPTHLFPSPPTMPLSHHIFRHRTLRSRFHSGRLRVCNTMIVAKVDRAPKGKKRGGGGSGMLLMGRRKGGRGWRVRGLAVGKEVVGWHCWA